MTRKDYDCLTGISSAYFVDWTDLKKFVLLRDRYMCKDCGKQSLTGLKVHHIEKILSGGENSPDNLITLCSACHNKRHRSK